MFKHFMLAMAALMLSAPAHAVETGSAAPAIHATDITGKHQSLEAYKGKIVVLEWHNPSCPFVVKHYGSDNMQKLQEYAASKGVVWLTINSSAEGKQGSMTTAEAQGYLQSVGSKESAYILDPQGKIGKLYNALTTPHMYVIDADGKLAYQGAIDDKPGADKEDVKTANNYVRAAIDALLAGKTPQTGTTKAYGCGVKYKD